MSMTSIYFYDRDKKNGRKTIRIGSISITFAFRNQQIMRSHAQ